MTAQKTTIKRLFCLERLTFVGRSCIGLFALWLGACTEGEAPSTVVKVIEDNPVVLVTTPVIYKITAEPVYPGVVQAYRSVELAFPAVGRLMSRTAKVGDRVATQAILASQESELPQAQQKAAVAHLNAQESSLQWVLRDVQRAKQLLSEQFISPSYYEKIKANADMAQASVVRAKADRIGTQKTLRDNSLRAPFSGVVVATSAEAGQIVLPNVPVIKLADDSTLDVVFSVPEQDREHWSIGTDAHVLVLAESKPYLRKGRVREVAPESEGVTRTYQIKLALNKAELVQHPIPLGSTVKVGQRLTDQGGSQPLYLLPMGALYQLRGEPIVWGVRVDQRVVPVRVKVAGYHPRGVIVQTLFAPDSVVVAAGAHLLREDEKVRPEIWPQWNQLNLDRIDETAALPLPVSSAVLKKE